jgi:hypothetical protein
LPNLTPIPNEAKKELGNKKYKKKDIAEAVAFASRIIDDEDYRQNLYNRALAGTLAPAIETLLWYYRYGKPVHRVEVGDPGSFDYSNLSNKELQDRLDELKIGLVKLDDAA